MVYKLVIQGRLPGTNDYSRAQKAGPHKGQGMKNEQEEYIGWHIRAQMNGLQIKNPVSIVYIWVEENTRRDKDNIRQGEKFIQDALVKMGVLKGDGWKHIRSSHSEFTVETNKPRVEVILVEQPV